MRTSPPNTPKETKAVASYQSPIPSIPTPPRKMFICRIAIINVVDNPWALTSRKKWSLYHFIPYFIDDSRYLIRDSPSSFHRKTFSIISILPSTLIYFQSSLLSHNGSAVIAYSSFTAGNLTRLRNIKIS